MALGYLLGAAIQFEDKNGKPLVGGTIRVCLHGTSTPYLTYRDFNGNRNPEFVPLNAAGMCVLIADDANAYDVYCKDQFGVEQWSRLNVTVGGAGGGGGGGSYVAGDGILIVNDTISVDPSVVQGTLTEGTGIVIDGNDEISVDTTVIQEKLTAGSNITIDGSTISATDHDTTYTATAPLAIDSSNDISVTLGNGLTTDNGALVVDTSVIQEKITVDQTYDSTSSNPQSGTAVAEAIASVNQVPTPQSSDINKVLSVINAQGDIGWSSVATGVTVYWCGKPSISNARDTAVSVHNALQNGFSEVFLAWYDSNDYVVARLVRHNDDNYDSGPTLSYSFEFTSGSVSHTYYLWCDVTAQGKPWYWSIGENNFVPSRTSSDENKVLGVTDAYGTLGWVGQNDPLPSLSGNAGRVLTVNSGETGVEWGTPTAELFEAVYDTTTYAQVTQAIAAKKIVYCRVPQSGTAVRMAFLAYVGASSVEFQYYRSKSSRTYSAPTDEVYVYTVTSSGWTTTTRNTDYQIVAGSGLSYTVTTGNTPKLTLSADPQQQSNWTESDTSSVQYIQNKPVIIPEPTQDTTQVNWWARNVDTNGVASWVTVPFNYYSMQTVWRSVTGTKAADVTYWGTDILIPDQVPVGVEIACNVIFDVAVEGLALGSFYTVSVDSVGADRTTGARSGTTALWYHSCIVTRSTVDGGQSCFNMTLPVDSRGTSIANWWRFDISGLPSAQANITVKYRLNTIMGRATDPSVRLGDIRAQWE